MEAIAEKVVASGEAWLSLTRLAPDVPALRACITYFGTGEEDVDALVASLARIRTAHTVSG